MIARHLPWLIAALAWPALAQVEQAQRQIDAEDLSGARATLETHLRTAPADASARFLLARVLAWQGEPQAALAILDDLLGESPNDADYLLAVGQAQLWSGRPHQAVTTLERAAAVAPDYLAVNDALRQARLALAIPSDRITLPRQDSPRRHELDLSLRQDWLSDDLDNWRRQRLDYFSTQAQGPSWYGALIREHRFGESDTGIEAGAVLALDENWSLQPEIGYQASPFFLPDWYADLRLQRKLPNGFLGALSARRTEYDSARVDRLALGVERYWDAWRAGYTLNVSDVSNAGTPVGHNASLDYYYAGLSYAGLRLTAGKEQAVEGAQVITSDVQAVGLQGRHWLSSDWAISWEVGHHEQGDYYSRRWMQLGLRHVF